jgi:hypothetical protein
MQSPTNPAMTPKQTLPMPSADDHERYRQLLRSWATYTGLEESDPYIQVTGHIYGLCIQVNEHQADTQQQLTHLDARLNRIEQFMITLDDRLTNIETQPSTTAFADDQPIEPNILKMLCDISDKLDAQQQGAFSRAVKDPTYDLHKGHILLLLRGVRILVVMLEKLSSTTNSVTSVGNVDQDVAIETKNLNNAMANTGYRFQPFSRGKKILDWVKFACHDVDGKWLLKLAAMAIALPLAGFSIGLGQNYAQVNHWFDAKPNVQHSAPKTNP